METKSRYEALNDLQTQKRSLMTAKFNLQEELKQKEKSIKEIKRSLEDAEEVVKEFRESLVSKEQHYDGLIAAVDKGIEVFQQQLNSQKK